MGIPAGSPLYATGHVAGDTSVKPGLCLDDEYQQGDWRLIGVGIEVVNTSAALNKQGSVVCGRIPVGRGTTQYQRSIATTPAVQCMDTLPIVTGPPDYTSVLANYPDAVSWKAAEGCYMVCTMNTLQNEPQVQAMSYGWIGEYKPYTSTAYVRRGWGTFHSSLASSSVVPWDISIARFSGLSAETTLQIKAKYIIETFPQPEQRALIGFQQPTTDWDPLVMKLYSEAMTSLPVACPVRENPLGEWFNRAMRIIANVAPKIGPLIGTATGFPEIGAPVGFLVGKGAQGALALNKRSARNKRKTKRNTKTRKSK
jgi:hypothetical protein